MKQANVNRARLAVFISGGGTGLQAIIDASKRGDLIADVVWVVSNSSKAFGLERAKNAGIETFVFLSKKYGTPEEATVDLLTKLHERKVEYIALAGYLKLLPVEIIRAYPKRIVNIHPGLLPKYGGPGMYGHFVHEAVIAAGEKESGPTVHIVDEIYDHGRILEQVRVPVLTGDTPDSLAARVLVEEHKLYPRVIDNLIRGKYDLD
ncbi:MAG: phosphoribosylglycinamide formyltransferase [candidate division Zixibacteria bacterium]|nr:phosphoribosylglycinamide formyltransferase [candidate division Zixibacteria bacterium]